MREIDGAPGATHAFVDYHGNRGLALVVDRNIAAAERVVVGERAHEFPGKRDDLLLGAVGLPTACAVAWVAGVVVSHVTCAELGGAAAASGCRADGCAVDCGCGGGYGSCLYGSWDRAG